MNVDNINYEIEIVRKSNKNTYIRVKDSKIIVTTSYLMPNYKIERLIIDNKETIEKMIIKSKVKEEKNNNFYYLGNIYDIIIVPTIDIEVDEFNKRIFVKSNDYLDKWLKKKIELLFKERLNYIYNQFEENIPYPKLRIRKMKTRWGVCSKKNIVTLNSELIKYTLNEIDYVIVHELSHFIYFNHSKQFWNLVNKYCSNYKECRKKLKN